MTIHGDTVVAGCLLSAIGLFVVGVAVVITMTIVGLYSYDYRCVDGVKEQQYQAFHVIPIGGYEPIDGDPAGACGR